MNQNGADGWRLVRLLSRGGGFLRAASRSAFNEQRVEEVAKVNFVLKIRLAHRTALCANDPGAIDDHDLRDLQTVCRSRRSWSSIAPGSFAHRAVRCARRILRTKFTFATSSTRCSLKTLRLAARS